MQDYKEMGDQFELRLGNREVALLVGALFLVVVLAFSLGVMMGKRLYGPAGGQQVADVAAPQEPAPTAPDPASATSTEPAPAATSEQYTFYDSLRDEPTDTEPTSATPPSPAPAAQPASAPEPAPQPTPPSTQPAPTPPSQGQWAIQVEAGPRKDGAQDKVRLFKRRGLDAWVSTVQAQGKTWYRVMIGHFPSYETAEEEMKKLKKAKVINPGAFIRKQ